jgi:hypothetical protein
MLLSKLFRAITQGCNHQDRNLVLEKRPHLDAQ